MSTAWLLWVQGRAGEGEETWAENDWSIFKNAVQPHFSSGKIITKTTKKIYIYILQNYHFLLQVALSCSCLPTSPWFVSPSWISVFLKDSDSHKPRSIWMYEWYILWPLHGCIGKSGWSYCLPHLEVSACSPSKFSISLGQSSWLQFAQPPTLATLLTWDKHLWGLT